MAGDWIKVLTSLPTSGKIVRISSACDADILRTLGGCVSALCLADVHAIPRGEEGWLDGYTPEALDNHIGIVGLTRALESAGWVRVEAQAVVFLEFTKHNGSSAKRRAMDSERKKRVRKTSASDADKMRRSLLLSPLPPGSEGGAGETTIPGFPEFWRVYPPAGRSSQADAEAAWFRALKSGADPAVLVSAAAEYAASPKGQSGQFVKYAHNWLDGRGWLDDRASWRLNGKSDGAKGAGTTPVNVVTAADLTPPNTVSLAEYRKRSKA